MRVGVIGKGAIGNYVRKSLLERGHDLGALLLRPESLQSYQAEASGIPLVSTVKELPDDIEHMIDCAGHIALKTHGAAILRRGIDLTTVSIGGLADEALYHSLAEAAVEGNAKLYLVSGAIGALDALLAARIGDLQSVTYSGRKPPQGWKGSPAEEKLDLDNLKDSSEVHFDGTAREAATQYPKNANVAAAVALAGVGFDATRVKLIADPGISENIHEIQASGDFGSFSFEIRGNALPENPRSSALAAMSVISSLDQKIQPICF